MLRLPSCTRGKVAFFLIKPCAPYQSFEKPPLILVLSIFFIVATQRHATTRGTLDHGRRAVGIDAVVHLKMLMVGFLEPFDSKHGIASRCADIRSFLGNSLTEAAPDHSSLSVIRERLSHQPPQ